MSLAASKRVWKLKIPPSHRLVMLAYADAANTDGVAWISPEKIAARIGLSVRHCKRIIAHARKNGWLRLVGRGVGGKGLYNRYLIAPENHDTGDMVRTARETMTSVIPNYDVRDQTMTFDARKGDTHDTRIFLEPYLEPK